MGDLTGTLGGLTLETFNIPFTEAALENAVDVNTLDGTLYTDFVNQKRQWSSSWAALTEAQYNSLRAVFDSQFTGSGYPQFVLPYYNIDVPVRMHINDKNITQGGCIIRNTQVILTEQYATGSAPDYLLLENGELLLADANNYLAL